MSYPAPAREARSEQEIKRSRFIGVVLPARTIDEVNAALERLRLEFPDATHHPWGYVLGNPGSSPRMRADDDGEPLGTAGKPILNVLTKRGVGDTLLVVVRYFGGVKLGAGGLVRAYASTASAALDGAILAESATTVPVAITASFADEKQVRHILEERGVALEAVDYGESVVLSIELPEEQWESLRSALSERTRGRVKVKIEPDL